MQQRRNSNSYIVRLAIKELDFLEKVKAMLGSDHQIRKYKDQELYYLSIFNRTIAEDLLRLGMVPNKSKVVQFPTVPTEYRRYFIRGCFEGDGSVFYEKRSALSPLRTKFCSGSRLFLEDLEKVLRENLGLGQRKIYESHGSTFYEIKYSHKESLELFSYMYDQTSERERLDRKYNKFLPYLTPPAF